MSPDAPDQTHDAPLALGVNLAGYFGASVGLGEAARQLDGALRAAGVAVAPLGLTHRAAQGAPAGEATAEHPVTIVCSSPEGMAGARAEVPDAFAGRRVVGMWWWEVMAFPSAWLRAFDDVDEVWVGSRFVADALAAVSPVPVVRIALPVAPPAPAPADRAALGLPEGFLFGFVFDYESVVERKNPLGLIDAFSRAFAPGEAQLVLKTVRGDRHRVEHAAVMAAAADRPDVHVIDRDLPAAEKDALIAALDCYVSLHRSEGFGLTMAEAALLGTPVIATDYGGPRDFLTPFNSFLVDHRPVAIGPGHHPYPADGEWAQPNLDQGAALMRAVRDAPEEAALRAQRLRADVEREHAPAVAGRAMAARLQRVLGLSRANGAVEALDVGELARRLRAGPATGGASGLRASTRAALLRALRPYSAYQRQLDEDLLRLIRTLDERVRGIAAAQSSLAAELARLRREVEQSRRVPPSPGP
jgi:Glycosyl transferases group 1